MCDLGSGEPHAGELYLALFTGGPLDGGHAWRESTGGVAPTVTMPVPGDDNVAWYVLAGGDRPVAGGGWTYEYSPRARAESGRAPRNARREL